jgi:hypothetical protein
MKPLKGKKVGHTAIKRANWRARASAHRVSDAERERMMKMVLREWPDALTDKLTPDQLRRMEERTR